MASSARSEYSNRTRRDFDFSTQVISCSESFCGGWACKSAIAVASPANHRWVKLIAAAGAVAQRMWHLRVAGSHWTCVWNVASPTEMDAGEAAGPSAATTGGEPRSPGSAVPGNSGKRRFMVFSRDSHLVRLDLHFIASPDRRTTGSRSIYRLVGRLPLSVSASSTYYMLVKMPINC